MLNSINISNSKVIGGDNNCFLLFVNPDPNEPKEIQFIIKNSIFRDFSPFVIVNSLTDVKSNKYKGP